MRNVVDNVLRTSKHTFYVSNFFPPENRGVYEVMLKNMAELDWP